MIAELQFGAGIVMLEGGSRISAGWGQNTQGIGCGVPDPDAHFARAKQAGAKIIQAPETKHYGARLLRPRPGRILWGFSTYKPSPAADGVNTAIRTA